MSAAAWSILRIAAGEMPDCIVKHIFQKHHRAALSIRQKVPPSGCGSVMVR
jgi:hypothetical protein